MLFRVAMYRWVRRIARAVLPAPRPKFSREAMNLAIRYATTPLIAQRLVDALGVEQAEASLLIGRTFNIDPKRVAEQMKS